MATLPSDLKYAPTHEWARLEDNNTIRIGITDFAQEQLGDLVYIELPAIGRKLAAKEQCAVVESVKTASDLYSPIAGEVIAVNEALSNAPELVNDSPYEAWIFCLKADDVSGLASLIDAEAYQHQIEE
jgi:glycine cleavage system H protein